MPVSGTHESFPSGPRFPRLCAFLMCPLTVMTSCMFSGSLLAPHLQRVVGQCYSFQEDPAGPEWLPCHCPPHLSLLGDLAHVVEAHSVAGSCLSCW